jgi:dTDP-4-amino-4,6-dideoxygalactose transaminase
VADLSKRIAAVMEEADGRIVLFRPNVPAGALARIGDVLSSRWIGQGPRVEEFERTFEKKFSHSATAVSCGSGTDALHLAYLLAGVKSGDEVLCPVFTCTATNLPALYIGATPIFVDIDPQTLNINITDLESKISSRTKAIVFVDYGGQPADLESLLAISKKYSLPLIEDAAHALGASYNGVPIGSISDYTIFSFQAIKHITTGDGGMLMIRDSSKVEEAKRLRWFGIDRNMKFNGIWENDITEVGYKYQMNDISAAMGLAALEEFDEKIKLRRDLSEIYNRELAKLTQVEIVGAPFPGDHGAWLYTILVPSAFELRDFLFKYEIESGQVHFRNDRYTVFGGRKTKLLNMDSVEDKYLVLPLHTHMTPEDVLRVCSAISDYFNAD